MSRVRLYERRHEPVLSRGAFALRMVRHGGFAAAVIVVALGIGVVGYHGLADLGWVDALENAAMILTGMGPIARMPTAAAKLFATGYALFSGVVFISTMGILLAPAIHRVLHQFHVDERDTEPD